MLGGHQPRTMGLAVQYADIWSDYARESSLPEAFEPVLRQLDAICAEQGRDPGSLGRSIGVIVEPLNIHAPEEAELGVPITGSAEEIAAQLRCFGELGVTRVELVLFPPTLTALDAVAPVLGLLAGSPGGALGLLGA